MAEAQPPTDTGVPEEANPHRDVDVLLDVSELEVDKIHLKVRDLRARVSVLAELASLVDLQVGMDARLDLVELEIEGVRAKVLLKVRLDNVRAILVHALDTVAEHPEILETLTRAFDELLTGTLGNALGRSRTCSGTWRFWEHGRRGAQGQPGGGAGYPTGDPGPGRGAGPRSSGRRRRWRPGLARGDLLRGQAAFGSFAEVAEGGVRG